MHGLYDKSIRTKRLQGREFDSDNWDESDSYVSRVSQRRFLIRTSRLIRTSWFDSDIYFDSDSII